MRSRTLLPFLLLACAPASDGEAAGSAPAVGAAAELSGRWRAALDGPGGEIVFGVSVSAQDDGGLSATLHNGPEVIAVPDTRWDGEALVLDLDHYEATVRLAPREVEGEAQLAGRWRRRSPGAEAWSELPAMARRERPEDAPSAPEPARRVDGRWRVRFASENEDAVALFETRADGALSGTFLTTTGDYRWLDGRQQGDALWLSCFDGAHAFRFEARLQEDGSLDGDFWSREVWHDTFHAVRDNDASLPDGFTLTSAEAADLSAYAFPDLDGVERTLADPAFAGRARILQVFGSWCPNCHDAAEYLSELSRRYGPEGLSVVGLAFEHTGDFARDAEQVRRYAARHEVSYPLLVAGLSDKAEAGRALPFLDAVRSYPTTVFLHGDGRVAAVYQGFAGPATGEHHQRLRARFEQLIEDLLAAGQTEDEG